MSRKRDYKKEYREYHGTEEQKEARASRNNARRRMEREGKVRKGDGKEVDHKDGNPLNRSRSNLQVMSRSANRRKGD